MDFLLTTELSVPLVQIALLLGLSTLAMLFGKTKLAILINYLFTLYWGYFLNRDLLLETFEHSEVFAIVYFSVGIFIAVLAMISFIRGEN
jgi:hypothetical protein